jgi:hypothetical protein
MIGSSLVPNQRKNSPIHKKSSFLDISHNLNNNAGDNSAIKVGPSVKPGELDKISKDLPAAKIVYDKNAGGNGVQPMRLAAHKTPRRVMDEMRANSVPFTKTELTKFLKSI